ncbi:S66 family peptidase [Janibacter cremeus]|uniref:Muramoyltetrapeptide carboxypeptidase LdcA involved in peptidoglycan recycling n=1 Tax=Janibacter cremeus TaxID=1285192 RepID=A0A852VSD6_9MICO|nr:S66 peptidase family protein [Janibacter cremeus]NYF99196.1 muramoyltetrapeptide carboxypeptidase LdcA involved in peptidoglycan recycling [Janibacter cremeus]
MSTRLPAPLRPGDTIAVTAPSSGVTPELWPRLDAGIAYLRRAGFEVIEGVCLRDRDDHHVSASREARADELMALLVDPDVAAVVPPWGGETGIDLLPFLDFELLAECEPGWYVGFSDTTTTMLALTLRSGWATLHGMNLMDTPYAPAPGLVHWLDVAMAEGGELTQRAATHRRADGWDDYVADPEVDELTLTVPTQWSLLDGSSVDVVGPLVGGCIEVLSPLVGTPFADVPTWAQQQSRPPIVLLEAGGDDAFTIARALHGFRLAGWFERCAGVLIGRTPAPDGATLTQHEAVREALGDLDVPVVLDVDFGHQQPMMPLVLGAPTRVEVGAEQRITQDLTRH